MSRTSSQALRITAVILCGGRASRMGGADKGHFKPGTYRYEVWYNDMCLKQCVFRLK